MNQYPIPFRGIPVQSSLIQSDINGLVTWIYPQSFIDIPEIVGSVVANGTDDYSVRIVTVTINQCILQVQRTAKQAVALISLTINLPVPNTGGAIGQQMVHVHAAGAM